MEHVTLKHVAKVSGFSVTTVSRVLGGTDYPISAEARDAITGQGFGIYPEYAGPRS